VSLPRFARLLALTPLVALLGLAAACADEDTPSTANPFSDRVHILVIHSYDEGFRWTAEQGKGIVEGLRQTGLQHLNYDLRVFFMDTRVQYTTPEQVDERAAEALRMIDDFQPKLVFVTDDVALREVAVPYAEGHPDSGVAFVFSGINVDPSMYPTIQSLDAPGGSMTGLLERIPVADTAAAAKRVFPSVSRMALLADGSASSKAAIDDFNATYPSGLHTPLDVTSFTQVKTFAEWQQRIAQVDSSADVIGLLNYHGLTDEAGKVVPSSDVLEWTLEHSTKPVIGLVTDWARDGLPMAVGNSGMKNGEAAAKIGARILTGSNPAQIGIVYPKLVETAFNLPAIERLGLHVPQSEIDAADIVIR
jgi:ABC-type uncharacterized transport system substrate-binding protein